MRLIKIGGGAAINLPAIARDLALDPQPSLIVLGANAVRDQLLQRLGMEKQTLVSRSGMPSVVTDDSMMAVIEMAYAGQRACQLVELLARQGVDACHLSGMDGGLIRAQRRRGIRTQQEGRTMVVHDLSGKPVSIRRELIDWLIAENIIPIITLPVLDENGHAVNCDNDEILLLLNQVLQPKIIIQLIAAPGLLRQADEPETLLSEVTPETLGECLSRAQGGMRRKLHALRRLLKNSNTPVVWSDGRVDRPLAGISRGTRFLKEQHHGSHAHGRESVIRCGG